MSVRSTVILNENGDGLISGEFKDRTGALVTPNTVKYSLNDKDGNIINSIDNISLTSFTTSYEIELSGADLALSATETAPLVERYLLIVATYGTKQDTNELKFHIQNLVGVKV